MNILTVAVSGVTEVNFHEFNKYIWIRNKTDDSVYASLSSTVTAGAEGTTEIPEKESGLILMSDAKTIYISGSGSVEIKASDFAECPFKVEGKGGDETVVHYLGVTTTPLYEGATTNPISINGSDVTAVNANWAVYNSMDYIYNGTVWQEFLDLTRYYTKTETDALLDDKADVDDVYTKTETNALLSAKANSADVYTKSAADDKFIAQADIVNAPTTAEINAAITNIWG